MQSVVVAAPPQMMKSEQMIHDAEALKARILEVPGNDKVINAYYLHPSMLDEDYLVIGGFVDQNIKDKIKNGEYVDFAKLILKDKITNEEDHRMEMVNRGGMSYWVPVAHREMSTINGFSKWEQAFCVFSNIYMSVIHTAAQTFIWDNVYRYDREFRVHMARHHLNRSWSTILQQAWSMYLEDGVGTPSHGNRSGGSNIRNNQVRKKLCFDFNSGNCTFGKRCKFDHRCSFFISMVTDHSVAGRLIEEMVTTIVPGEVTKKIVGTSMRKTSLVKFRTT